MAKKKTTIARKKRKPTQKTRRVASRVDYSTRILNCIPSTDTFDDWDVNTALAAGIASAAAIPPAKDLREAWWAIGDQGQTGSCVGWATADSVLRWHFAQTGNLDKKKTDILSVRFTWMASKETDIFNSRPTTFIETDGTSLKAAVNISRKFGAVRDALLPFIGGQLYQGNAKDFYATASKLRIANYINLGRNPQRWREWIANNGPILTRLNVDETWMNASANGVLKEYKPATTWGGHAVALVGYKSDSFTVRNSWGTGWGDKGFAHASNAYAIAAFTEAYGVSI